MTDKERFISQNQLETIFQKLYFKKVAENLKFNEYYLVETHGNAILGKSIEKDITIKNKKYNLGFDYQNGTFKTFFISQEYPKSNRIDLPKEIPKLFKNLEGNNKYGYEKANKPISQAYFSVTKKRNKCIGMGILEFSKIYLEELKISKNMIKNELIDKLHKLTND